MKIFWHAFNYVHLGSYLQFCRMLIASMLKEKHESMSEQTVTSLGGGGGSERFPLQTFLRHLSGSRISQDAS